VMGYDEAFTIPSEEAVTLALRTQQIIAHETGVVRTADPLGGSFFLERLTDELEQRAGVLLQEIEGLGGMPAAIEAGTPQRWIAESAYRTELETLSGERAKIGVNLFADSNEDTAEAIEVFAMDESVAERQIARTKERLRARSGRDVSEALSQLESDARNGKNVMPSLIEAAKVTATVGEMSDVFRELFGEFREPSPW
jgi:methylmalonyl-CoA mutase, N-terminal domain